MDMRPYVETVEHGWDQRDGGAVAKFLAIRRFLRRRSIGCCNAKGYSLTFIPEPLITTAHCGISALIKAANSAGELPTISRPSASRRAWASGCARDRWVSRWTLSTMLGGVPAGATN